jgi:peptidoglycan/xylan/chitin deacetylase (PgdA/CDA1 family)
MSPAETTGRGSAVVSVDVDPVDLHLVGYGHKDLPADDLVYRAAMPRLAEVFARAGVRATFFVVGRDAPAIAPLLRSLAAAGHEIASHTLTHPMPFVRVARSRIHRELGESKRLLEEASGSEVIGFRAPNWDMSARAVMPLGRAGYRYDASGFPTPLQIPARMLLAWKARTPRTLWRMRPWPFTLRRHPYRWEAEGYAIQEFPISVTPWTRFPIYHTARYLLSERRFLGHLDGFVRRGEDFYYALHAVDALGQHEDRVNPDLARHPGMEHRLEHKLALLESSLRALADRFAFTTYRAQLAPAPAPAVVSPSAARV